MDKAIKKNYFQEKFLFAFFTGWALYAFLYVYFESHALEYVSGYMAFFGESLLDFIIIILSYIALKKSDGKIKLFFILFFVSFCFAFLSDVIYNFFLNLSKYKITSIIDSLFDVPDGPPKLGHC